MSDPIETVLEDGETGGRYVYRGANGTGPEAEMTFSKAGERIIIIDHTDVPELYKGQGIGQGLVERAVADARAAGKTIVPLCPFAAAMFRKHPDWADVLDRKVKPKA